MCRIFNLVDDLNIYKSHRTATTMSYHFYYIFISPFYYFSISLRQWDITKGSIFMVKYLNIFDLCLYCNTPGKINKIDLIKYISSITFYIYFFSFAVFITRINKIIWINVIISENDLLYIKHKHIATK